MAKKLRRQARTRRRSVSRIDWQSLRLILKPVVTLTVLMLVAVAGWRSYSWLTLPATLPVRHVEVRGDLQRIEISRLRQQVNEAVKGGFFSIDLEGVRSGLESMPWVYGASLRRIWPDRLIIEIEEQKPIAQWGETALLNQYGEVFEVQLDSWDRQLPPISGEDGREKQLIKAFIEADDLLHPLGLQLAGLREDARRDQRLFLSNGIELALGRKDRQGRLGRFVVAYRQTLAPFMERISSLDLRYANGFAVRWKLGEMDGEFTKTRDDRA